MDNKKGKEENVVNEIYNVNLGFEVFNVIGIENKVG